MTEIVIQVGGRDPASLGSRLRNVQRDFADAGARLQARPGTDGNAQVFDGGVMPELLRAMAEEVEAGRLPPPGPAR